MYQNLTTRQLCELWINTNPKPIEHVAPTRRALMAELERRNPQALEAWLFTKEEEHRENPAAFFL